MPLQRPGALLVVVVVVADGLGCQATAVELVRRDARGLDHDEDEGLGAVVGNRVVGRRRDQDQIALSSLSVSPVAVIEPAPLATT